MSTLATQKNVSSIPAMATEKSNWNDRYWIFTNQTPGQHQSRAVFDWEFPVSDGKSLRELGLTELLQEFRVFLWTAHVDPREGTQLGAGSVQSVVGAIQELASFMYEEGVASLSDLDSELTWLFAEFLNESYVDRSRNKGRPRKAGHEAFDRILRVVSHIWQQRAAMEELGFASLPEPPFDGETSYAVVVSHLKMERKGKLKPIPDPLAFRVMNTAQEVLLEQTPLLLVLQDKICGAFGLADGKYASDHQDVARYHKARDEIRASTELKTVSGKEFYLPIGQRQLIDERNVDLSEIQAYRHAVLSTVAAGTTSLQAETGMRAHELASLEDTAPEAALDPSCLTSVLSRDGLLECFFVEGITAKKRRPEAVKWLVGSRPAGSSYVPPPVIALRVLHKLLAPWRALGGSTKLLVSFSNGRGLPRSAGSIGTFSSAYLTYVMKEFLLERVDIEGLPDLADKNTLVREIRGHRWRPTFALHLYSISPGLLPAISDHFKHMNVATTEYGYIGTDTRLIESCDSARTLSVARLMLSISMGQMPVAGGMAKLLDKHSAELRELIESQPGNTSLDKAIHVVLEHGLKIYESPYGRCFMASTPKNSRCHNEKGTPVFLRTKPVEERKSEGTCMGCSCFAVYPEHIPYWERRLLESEAVLSEAKERGNEALCELRVEVDRAEFARRVVAAVRRKAA